MQLINILYYSYYAFTTFFALGVFTFFYKFLFDSTVHKDKNNYRNQQTLALIYFFSLITVYFTLTPSIVFTILSCSVIVLLFIANFINFSMIRKINSYNNNPIIIGLFTILNFGTNLFYELFNPIYSLLGINNFNTESITGSLLQNLLFNQNKKNGGDNLEHMLTNMMGVLGNMNSNKTHKNNKKTLKLHTQDSNDSSTESNSDESDSKESIKKYTKESLPDNSSSSSQQTNQSSQLNSSTISSVDIKDSEVATLKDIFKDKQNVNRDLKKVEKILNKLL